MKSLLIVSGEIKKGKKYSIHSVFGKTINIWVEKQIYALVCDRDFLSKRCLYISYYLPKITNKIRKGDDLILNDGCLILGNQSISLRSIVVYQSILKVEDVQIPCHLKQTIYQSLLKKALDKDLHLHVSARNYLFKEKLREAIQQMYQHLYKKKQIKMDYIGLGYGLTPCIDDYVVGILFIRQIQGFQEFLRILEGVSNDISYQMLKNANERVYYDVFYQLFKDDTPSKLQNVIQKILSIGSSSGYYMLLGMYHALEIGEVKHA
ncbi:MAG: DUF2877 domain-containing protein [Breznakia sp.]